MNKRLLLSTAKVAMQVVEYLKTAMNNLGSPKSPDSTVTEIAGSRKIKVEVFVLCYICYHIKVVYIFPGVRMFLIAHELSVKHIEFTNFHMTIFY